MSELVDAVVGVRTVFEARIGGSRVKVSERTIAGELVRCYSITGGRRKLRAGSLWTSAWSQDEAIDRAVGAAREWYPKAQLHIVG